MLVLGLISGTSADAIEAALVRIDGKPPKLRIKLVGHASLPWQPAIRKEILRVAEGASVTAGDLSQLNFRLGSVFADAALAACKKLHIPVRRVDLIGSHGQTIFHQGAPKQFLGKPTSSTLQIGEPAVIAARTGVTTIGDFRVADMAVGGQGAPLVPFADYLLYRHEKIGRVSLNLGGIANITVIPAGARPQDVFAFDTGPANILLDALVFRFTRGRQRFDRNAQLARRGRINNALIYRLMKDPFLKLRPPKSTGREYYGAKYVDELLSFARKREIRPADLLYTVTYFTADSVADALRRFVLPKHKISQLIVSGGGARNPLLMEQLQTLLRIPTPRFRPIEVLPSSHFHVPEEAKEAMAFALMAHETWHHRPSNLPSATGAARPAILGKICYA